MGTIHAQGDGQISVTTETSSRRGSGGGGVLFALLKLVLTGIRVIVKKSSTAIKESKQEKATTQE